DNSMRGIHELYGLTDYNKIPSRYDEIKGASFWKYMETKYGAKAIPTVMYMARFTRKFNQALYNSYQTSMSEVFVSWRDFYNRAYNADQIKPNPVGGLIFDEDLVSDFFINAVDEVYYIEEKWGGTSLYFMDLKTNERTKLYTLASDEFQIPEYGGAIAVYGDTISLLVNSESGARLVSILNDHIKKSQLGIGLASSLRVDKGKIFVLEADLLGSSVWEVLPVGIREAQKIEGFISSFDVDGQSWIWVEENDSSVLYMKNGNERPSTILSSVKLIKQAILVEGGDILFNLAANGVTNGKLLRKGVSQVENLTNYRSNILFHQYTDSVFVEYLSQGEESRLIITEHIPVKDFYIYEDLDPVYFFGDIEYENSNEQNVKKVYMDSLSDYSFQSPIPPHIDFISTNSDSLHGLQDDLEKTSIVWDASRDEYDVFSAHFKFVNRLYASEETFFLDNYRELMPSKVNLSVGTSFVNQYGTSKLKLDFAGLIQAGARDLKLEYINTKRKGFELLFLNRKRISYRPEEQTLFTTNLLEYRKRKSISRFIELKQVLDLRYDQLIPLLSANEVPLEGNESKLISSYAVSLRYDRKLKKSKLSSVLRLHPRVHLESYSWSTSIEGEVATVRRISPKLYVQSSLQLGNTFGPSSSYYILGGASSDLRSTYMSRDFSTYKNPLSYTNVYGVRGFPVNYRNGTTFFTQSTQLSFKPIELVIKRPIATELFSNLDFHCFVDMGTSFYGRSIYDKSNVLNQRRVVSNTGAIVIDIGELKNPYIVSTGIGLGTQVYGYKVSLDYAIGYEDQKFRKPIVHLGIGFRI
ncbi:MAG: hypothetical protein ACPGYY_08220, partial [Bacteroidia bacterium]